MNGTDEINGDFSDYICYLLFFFFFFFLFFSSLYHFDVDIDIYTLSIHPSIYLSSRPSNLSI